MKKSDLFFIATIQTQAALELLLQMEKPAWR
jgi:hypothetical protein